jgi:hypothetical protein
MSLFSNSDIEKFAHAQDTPLSQTASRSISNGFQHVQLTSFHSLEEHLPSLNPGDNKVFFSDGSWSNYELMEYLLQLSGPALVGFTTWSISEIAITRMNNWIASGKIIDLFAVLDVGIRNRKPHIYQQAIATLKNLKLSHCHAKVMAIVAPELSFLVIGSANQTKNPRKEAGVIICDRNEAEFALEWVKEIIDGANS